MNIFFENKKKFRILYLHMKYIARIPFLRIGWNYFFQSMYTYVNQMPSTVSLFKSTHANAYLSQF